MKFTTATVITLATAVLAFPNEKRSVDPAAASLALYNVLPSSLKGVALTNPAAAASEISSEFQTGTPTWFTALPTDVQSYFITAGGPASTAGPYTTGSGGHANATGKYSNTTSAAATTGAATTNAAGTTSLAAGTTAGAATTSTSTGGASLPTGIVGAGLAGALGLVGMLAL